MLERSETGYVFPAPARPSLAVMGEGARFPVRRVFCVGRNYAAHAREMGHSDREPPFFFTKPADAVLDAGPEDGAMIPYPPLTEDLHHEVELVVAIGRGGERVEPAEALGHVFGYAVGVDLTRRDLQAEAKAKGRPWDWAKAFDRSAPMGRVREGRGFDPTRGRIWLEVDGDLRQEADLSGLIWSVAGVIAAVSCAVALRPGDLIMTGTPAGVGAIAPGARVRGGVEGLAEVAFAIGPRA